MRYLLLSVMILSLSFVNCAPPSQSDLYGTYVADYEFAREKLVLYKDGTYHQEVILKSNSQVDTANGTWSYRPYRKEEPGSGYIGFHDFIYTRMPTPFGELNPDYANPAPGSQVVLPVYRKFNNITIGSSQSIVYKKIDQAGES